MKRTRRMTAFDSAIERFHQQQARGAFGRGQLVASVHGTVVAESYVGCDARSRFQVMSASKPFVALAIAILERRGLVDVGAPVARYLPGFVRDITVLDVLTHRSGMLLERLVRAPETWSDEEARRRAILTAEPTFPRGTLAYESHAFGWILADIVRAVSGRSLPELLAEELPPSLAQIRWIGAEEVVPVVWAGKRPYMLGGVDLSDGFEHVNNEIAARTAFVPGAGLAATARELVALYDLFQRGDSLIQSYTARATSGRDRVTGAWVVLGRGLSRGWLWPHPFGWWGSGGCYGHAGGFGVVAFADPTVGLSAAIVTDTHRGMSDLVRRFAPLASALRAAARTAMPARAALPDPR